jgi:molybdopterin synthase catalytic subunit
MDIATALADLKREPGFADNAGMVLIHNGVVRNWSRSDQKEVARLRVRPDHGKIESIRAEYEAQPGIFRVLIHAREGVFEPGDDLLFIVVAGDVRENVVPALSQILDRIKGEAMDKEEIAAG